MKTPCRLALVLLWFSPLSVWAATHYVNINNANPTPPYTNWATAATDIQSAVDAAGAADEILVTNGVYAGGSQVDPYGDSDCVVVDTPLTLQSVNGPDVTVIDGGGAVRCLYLTGNSVMVGFTLTNGFIFNLGGGVFCESTNAVLTNCVLTGNSAPLNFGGGAYGGTLNNCTLTGNSGEVGGGAIYSTLNNCTLTGNSVYASRDCGLCRAAGGGAYGCTLNNCTITGNSGWGASGCTLNNCTVYFNSDPNGGNYDPSSTLNYCCTTPMPTSGVGNITNDPAFVNAAAGNYHLSSGSPCINAGDNAYVVGSTDLDGRPRIIGGTVDMGAYEYRELLVCQGSPSPVPPYATWATAATNIQDAVDAALFGDEYRGDQRDLRR